MLKNIIIKLMPFIFCAWGLYVFHGQEIWSGLSAHTGEYGDARFVIYTLEHCYQWMLGKVEFLSPQFFYPEKNTLGFSDPMLGFSFPYVIFRHLGYTPYPASSLNLIFWNIVSFFTCYYFSKKMFLWSTFLCSFFSFVVVFNSPKLNQLVHFQLQPLAYILCFLAGMVYVVKNHTKLSNRAFFFVTTSSLLSLNLQLLSAFYMAWFACFFVLLLIALSAYHHGFSPLKQTVMFIWKTKKTPIILSLTVFLIALIPFVLIYLPTLKDARVRRFSETLPMIPDIASYLSMGKTNWIWSTLVNTNRWVEKAIDPAFYYEHNLGLGLMLTLMWVYLLCSQLKNKPKDINLNATFLFQLLAFRIQKISLWILIFFTTPGAIAIRAVGRMSIFMIIPLLFAITERLQALLSKKQPYQQKLIYIVCLLAIAEQAATPITFDAQKNWAYLNDLSLKIHKDCKSFYIKTGSHYAYSDEALQIDAMWMSMISGVPTLNGYSGFRPRQWPLSNPKEDQTTSFALEWAKNKKLDHVPCEVKI